MFPGPVCVCAREKERVGKYVCISRCECIMIYNCLMFPVLREKITELEDSIKSQLNRVSC